MNFRRCTGCNKILERKNLIKITRSSDDQEIVIMPDSKKFGRSVYLCYNKDCYRNAIKKKRFQKALKREIAPSFLGKIEKLIDDDEIQF